MPGNLKSGEVQATPPITGVLPQQQSDRGVSHIVNFSTKEMQEALKDMEITRQVCVCVCLGVAFMWDILPVNVAVISLLYWK